MSDASYGLLGPGNGSQSASVNRANGCGTDLVQGVRSAGGTSSCRRSIRTSIALCARSLQMRSVESRLRIAAMAACVISAALSLPVLAGPPAVSGFNAAQEAVRMSMVRSTMLARTTGATQKTAATNQKANTATHTTGQPNQTCGSASAPETPGHASTAPGSAFNPNGNAGPKYAGQQPQNSKNPTSVAQYDVACSHQK